MFGFSGAIKFYYCPTPISMRKSFDGLAGAVEEYIQQDSESGHAFVFFVSGRPKCTTNGHLKMHHP